MPIIFLAQAHQVHIMTITSILPANMEVKSILECTDLELSGAEIYYDSRKLSVHWPQPHQLMPKKILEYIFQTITRERKESLATKVRQRILANMTLEDHCRSFDEPISQDRNIFVTVIPENEFLDENILSYIDKPNFIYQQGWVENLPISSIQFDDTVLLAYCESLDTDHDCNQLPWLSSVRDMHIKLIKPYLSFVQSVHENRYIHGDLHEGNSVLSLKYQRLLLYDFKHFGNIEYVSKEENEEEYYIWHYFRLKDLVNLANSLLLHVGAYCDFVDVKQDPFMRYLDEISHQLDFLHDVDPFLAFEDVSIKDIVAPYLKITIEEIQNKWQACYSEELCEQAFVCGKRSLTDLSMYAQSNDEVGDRKRAFELTTEEKIHLDKMY